ncbi:MAG: glycoside hydrolase family 31 protein [Lacunisphaera sp.]|nr:glycoside hydrolase family 31 protein [Lacunisphaera sp.]
MSLLASVLLAAPPAAPALDWAGLQPVGAAVAATRTARGVQFSCADGSAVTLTVLAPDLVRVRTLFAGQPAAPDHSWAVARTDWPAADWSLAETPAAFTLTTGELAVVVHRDPLLIEFRDAATGRVINRDERPMARDPKSGRVAAAKQFGFDEHFYGLGEKTAHLDRRRSRFVLWNSDTPGYTEGTDPIYQSIPFYLGWEDGRAYGLFYDNSHRTTFDFGYTGQEAAAYEAAGGVLDYYFFHGPALKKIIGRYTDLTGRMPLPPLWALGHQQSRYSYYPDKMVEQVAAQYRAHRLPLDVIHLDIHYMDAYRVFTWNQDRFPDPAGLAKKLSERGVKLITIVDPGVKYQPADPAAPGKNYPVYDEGLAQDYFLRRQDGSLYIGEVWPGKAVFVDYTKENARRWWGEKHRALIDRGIAGIWTDMNEPSDFVDKSGATQRDVVFDDLGAKSLYAQNRNTFALNMARATYEGLQRLQPDKRPFVITRAGYAGIQRYAITWIGDSNATFDQLALSVPMFASMGLSGQPFVGADTPGFIGRGSAELLVRAYQVAAFTPFCRNHTAVDVYDHEPWRFGVPYENMVRAALELRYRLLPFLYTTLEEAHRTGVPLFRPLLLEFQQDYTALNLDDQFMVGAALLAAPVVRDNERARDVYLPAGRWYDYWTGAALDATGDLRRVDAPLERMPLFVRGGSIVPSTIAMNHTGEKPWNPLRFDVWPDANGAATGSLYEDDGASPAYLQGAFRRTTLSLAAGRLTFGVEGDYRPPARNFEVFLHQAPAVREVLLDGRPLDTANWGRDAAGTLSVRLKDNGQPLVVEFR